MGQESLKMLGWARKGWHESRLNICIHDKKWFCEHLNGKGNCVLVEAREMEGRRNDDHDDPNRPYPSGKERDFQYKVQREPNQGDIV